MPEPLLEIREPEGTFERIEAWLRGRGFFEPGGEELQADLYLGYGLAIRRDSSPPPPEPYLAPLGRRGRRVWTSPVKSARPLGGAAVLSSLARDSDPAAEVEESWTKARPLLEAIGAPLPETVAT